VRTTGATPFVRVAHARGITGQGEPVGAIHSEQSADPRQGGSAAGIQGVARLVEGFPGCRRDQLELFIAGLGYGKQEPIGPLRRNRSDETAQTKPLRRNRSDNPRSDNPAGKNPVGLDRLDQAGCP
jgi:hypothetical protein